MNSYALYAVGPGTAAVRVRDGKQSDGAPRHAERSEASSVHPTLIEPEILRFAQNDTKKESPPPWAERRSENAPSNEPFHAGDPADTHASGVIGGVHDFSRFTHRAADVCSACHVPHVQAVRPEAGPAGQTVLNLYRIEGQRQVFTPGRYMPGPSSTICISCHNGVVAGSTMSTSHALIFGEGTDRERSGDFAIRDHPIGIPYPTAPKNYRPQGFVEKQGLPLPEGRIECVSCHDPHNEAGNDHLLVMSNKRSALCLTCHKK